MLGKLHLKKCLFFFEKKGSTHSHLNKDLTKFKRNKCRSFLLVFAVVEVAVSEIGLGIGDPSGDSDAHGLAVARQLVRGNLVFPQFQCSHAGDRCATAVMQAGRNDSETTLRKKTLIAMAQNSVWNRYSGNAYWKRVEIRRDGQ